MFLRRAVVVLGLLCACALASSASAGAQTLSPWWGLSTQERPTNLHAGAPVSEVQELTATPGFVGEFKGVWLEVSVGGKPIGEFTSEEIGALLHFPEPTKENLQTALESPEAYGPGGVVVSGGPANVAPLVIESTRPGSVAPLEVIDHAVEGGTGGAHASVLTEGKSDGVLVVTAENLGNGPAEGSTAPIHMTDTVPAGLKAVGVKGFAGSGNTDTSGAQPAECSIAAGDDRSVSCTFNGTIGPYEGLEMSVQVVVEDEHAAAEGSEAADVSGGGAARERTIARPLSIGGPARFGISENTFTPEAEGGAPETQAGAHPFQLTSVLSFNQGPQSQSKGGEAQPVALPKDVSVLTPAGLVGNPTPFARCSEAQFNHDGEPISGAPLGLNDLPECATNTQVGVADVTIDEPSSLGLFKSVSPIFNLVPAAGEPARFGFYVARVRVFLDPSVRTGSDYGITVSSHDISQIPGLLSVSTTFWGVPGSPAHDGQRGGECFKKGAGCVPLNETNPPPFLTMPTSCEAPLQASVQADSWPDPSNVVSLGLSEPAPRLDGCARLPFNPSLTVVPDSRAGSSASGLTADVHVPQSAQLNPEGIAEGTVRDITVALPEGIQLNPSGGDGLGSCSEPQIGYEPGQSAPPSQLRFSSTIGEPFCPDAAKVGKVHIKTPLLPNELSGFVYLASQNANPFGSLVAMYVVAEDPVSGTLLKLPGEVHLGAAGQVTATFENSPQLPFEDASLEFFGGERAPLATPAHCGAYTTEGTFVPWSAEPSDEAVVTAHATSSFEIASGPNGAPCPGATLPFSPTLAVGTTNNNAGSFSPLTTTIGREDGQQSISAVTLHMPGGLEGLLANVKLCPEPQASQGDCPAESQIGETIVSAGVGSDPVTVTGGKVFLTESYDGAPFGLSIVNPVKAGPFDLEHDSANPANQPPCDCIVVRAKIDVNPQSAALTVTTGTIPSVIDGVPVQIKHVNVTIDHERFTFNPTNCNPTAIGATIAGWEGASSPLSEPFQVTNCANLAFKPDFKVSVTGKASKSQGAGLSVKLSYPPNSMGAEANIARVKVELPKQLPSRLTTLQKACLAATFNANPAACPSASIVGHARVLTPVLPVPLEGSAYFVSHGNEEFPNLTILLHGDGVTIELIGTTFISKSGITSTTFKATPDTPFSSFELTLPQGAYSALTANTNLCQVNALRMPSEFKAQNGAELRQSTSIAVTGCPTKLALLSHTLHGSALSLKVYAPAAGQVKLAGKGLSGASKRSKGRETLTFTLHATRHGHYKTKLRLTFKPAKGKGQSSAVKVRA